MWWKNDGSPDRKKRSGERLNRAAAAGLLAVLLGIAGLAMSGCGTDDIDISGYEDQTITITGVTDSDITLTIADLKAMDCVTVSTESTSDKIGRVRATGPTLDTVLRQFGMAQTDVGGVRIYGRDDYDVKLNSDVLAENDVILAFGIDGRPLGEEDAPLRLIIPGSDSAWWVRMIEKIELLD